MYTYIFPKMNGRLKRDSEIFMYSHFESGIAKIKDGTIGELNPEEIN